jgi:chromodomain-helicase-DNA-binding protein 4
MGCKETCLEPDPSLGQKDTVKSVIPGATPQTSTSRQGSDGDIVMSDNTSVAPLPSISKRGSPEQLLFRCFTCKRLAHYAHLPNPFSEDASPVELAQYYQENEWDCGDCLSFVFAVDKILAWRPYPSNAIEAPRPDDEPPNIKSQLPREYLVKWVGRSYRRVQWVPHLVRTKALSILL